MELVQVPYVGLGSMILVGRVMVLKVKGKGSFMKLGTANILQLSLIYESLSFRNILFSSI